MDIKVTQDVLSRGTSVVSHSPTNTTPSKQIVPAVTGIALVRDKRHILDELLVPEN